MARTLFINADVRITHGDQEIKVTGHDHRIEVSHSSIRFFMKTVRTMSSVTYPRLLTLDQMLRDSGLTVVLKTKYFCLKILGLNGSKWVRMALRFILTS
jgi:hypothetical protein